MQSSDRSRGIGRFGRRLGGRGSLSRTGADTDGTAKHDVRQASSRSRAREKKRVTTELSLRVDEVTKRIGKGNQKEIGAPSAATLDEKAALVARINRLEA